MVNYSGNNTKSLYLSVEASLKKLRTTYIDIIYCALVGLFHFSRRDRRIALCSHQQGKILYIVRNLSCRLSAS